MIQTQTGSSAALVSPAGHSEPVTWTRCRNYAELGSRQLNWKGPGKSWLRFPSPASKQGGDDPLVGRRGSETVPGTERPWWPRRRTALLLCTADRPQGRAVTGAEEGGVVMKKGSTAVKCGNSTRLHAQ